MANLLRKLWRENRGFALFIVLMVIFRSSLADWNVVPSGSMRPTIVEGDRILVNKAAYDLRLPLTHIPLLTYAEPQRNDIVVFDSEAADMRMVKRVVGLPGEMVEMRDNRLFINGMAARYTVERQQGRNLFVRERYAGLDHTIRIDLERASPLRNFGPVTVPDGHYLVLGDNRDNSADSRVYGFIPRREIVGRSREVVLSLDYDDYYLPRSGRFFKPL